MNITIIGSGVGGYPPAIRAARMGAAVTVVEKDRVGGVCLNWGCIPTKSLLKSAEVVDTIRGSETFGITCAEVGIDFPAVMKRKASVVAQLRTGVEKLLQAKKIRLVQGSAALRDASTVDIAETGEKIQADRIIIATGSRPIQLPVPGAELPRRLDPLDADDAAGPPGLAPQRVPHTDERPGPRAVQHDVFGPAVDLFGPQEIGEVVIGKPALAPIAAFLRAKRAVFGTGRLRSAVVAGGLLADVFRIGPFGQPVAVHHFPNE